MNIYKVLPDLKKKRQMHLWHTALRSQWSAEDVQWDKPHRITSRKFKEELAKVLTPVLMGEQAALYSVSGLIPILGHRSEVESQFYLTTWAVDEARHTELFARFYQRLDQEPLPIRRFPAGYLFQSRIVSKEPAEWLSGVLISEVLALLIMEEFKRLDIDPVLSDVSDGILGDEARHLGFNHIYLEDRFSQLYEQDAAEAESFKEHLAKRLDYVLEGVPPIFEALKTELDSIGLASDEVMHKLGKETHRRLLRSVEAGRRVAQRQSQASRLSEAETVGA
ncbi:MAG: ferritin-like domain-containing protein [Acidobacteriota bacterium]|nr:ferritin-like domain-containing protein [Acidobacteriota bacterium]